MSICLFGILKLNSLKQMIAKIKLLTNRQPLSVLFIMYNDAESSSQKAYKKNPDWANVFFSIYVNKKGSK